MRRTTAVATAGLLLLTGALPHASAQPSSSAPAAAKPNSVPPDLPPNTPPPVDKGEPDVKYERNNKGCVESDTKSELIKYMPWGQVNLNLEQAHRFAKGKGVRIAIIDTGVDPRNPRFGNRVIPGGDYVDKKNGTDDCDGHGTEVAGVAAAAKTEGDFVGAAPEAEILAIRQTSDRYEFKGDANNEKRSSAGKVSTLAMAIVRAANMNAKVINISLTNCGKPKGFSSDDQALQAAIRWAVDVKDVVIVTAAGNLSDQGTGCPEQNNNLDPSNVNSISSPAWFADDVLSVASISRSGAVSSFSVWGPWVSIAAPGEEIISVDPKGTGLTNANVTAQGTTDIKGTSFASPYVAGITALVRERFPDLKARQVMNRLKATALHPGNVSGKDNKVGYGMINPVAALTAVLPSEANGFQKPQPKEMTTSVTPPPGIDWPPIIVALSGIGLGGALLMLTLFVRNSLNRKRGKQA
ncbi:type VII secretion-associated serine protease mycosin [Lentzea flava]|uniref:Type VII secretion-associated serine protease n=1 Tax=Lentzea flava TaxID=103732 RepID=A0ABQ2V4M3_9PSEU|nr:type VII secretion-associated serine protease mycosin [Lentzea flava]MCP2202814.1 membrane-anchored mycosin MYCP [Lentzea flava]GGU63391.1 type VII secretion-associated serine protease [Lentzea flava]